MLPSVFVCDASEEGRGEKRCVCDVVYFSCYIFGVCCIFFFVLQLH